ncbi:hypothetical protein [Aquimarina sp. 2201CG14-23]|uniref:hypothetical protein n=1 Tax=Aquimarina mycalae TaxID=3040073 RepID=UPI0024782236|nr:hypothetical protein [Aquimarina sp. 2201CG14-23]MDH7446919.1 hypothetical protein [Aquimarina sp. 2201CG14-23]
MKKKKLEGLSLNKNIVSRLNSAAIKGGTAGTATCQLPGTRHCATNSAATPCFSRECIVQTGECEISKDHLCHSIDLACE